MILGIGLVLISYYSRVYSRAPDTIGPPIPLLIVPATQGHVTRQGRTTGARLRTRERTTGRTKKGGKGIYTVPRSPTTITGWERIRFEGRRQRQRETVKVTAEAKAMADIDKAKTQIGKGPIVKAPIAGTPTRT